MIYSCITKCLALNKGKWLICSKVLIVAYVLLTYYSAVCNREVSENYTYQLVPFWSYFSIHENESLVGQIMLKILLFVPIGSLINILNGSLKQSILYSALFSLSIEVSQLVFRTWMFKFDDIFHNVLGGFIGYGIIEFPGMSILKRNV